MVLHWDDLSVFYSLVYVSEPIVFSLSRALLHPSFTCCERVYCSKFSRTTMYVQRQSRCYRDGKTIPNNWHIKLPRLIKRMFVCVFKKQCANNEGKFKVYYRKTACLFYLSAFDAMRSSQHGWSCVSVCCVHIFSFTHWYWLLLLLFFSLVWHFVALSGFNLERRLLSQCDHFTVSIYLNCSRYLVSLSP